MRKFGLPVRAECVQSGPGTCETFSRRLLRFWNTPPENFPRYPLAAILRAAARLYEKGLRIDQLRARRKRGRLPAFTISIGNIVCGGTGKTPMTLWLSRFLLERGAHPAILSRGYGRKGHAPAMVPPEGELSRLCELFGDEPVLLAAALETVPVWVGRKRLQAGMKALEGGAVDTLVLDDGFQHLALERDLDIVLVDCRNPFGNGFPLPAGPLREPAAHLGRADALVLTHADDPRKSAEMKARLNGLFPNLPVFACRHKTVGFRPGFRGPVREPAMLRGQRAVAFAGIAAPRDFFQSLVEAGIGVRSAFSFPDHYRYRPSDLRRIIRCASRSGAEIILTTAKDAVRLPLACRDIVMVAEMEIDFGPDRDLFCSFLGNARVKAGIHSFAR